MLTQEQLAHTLLPLGGMTKAEVRAVAEANGFINAKKRESQDICFVPDGDYASFIERYTGEPNRAGQFVDKEGRALGEHRGFVRYTIGQRRGLGLSLREPLYVCAKCAARNTVVLGKESELFSKSLTDRAAAYKGEGPLQAARTVGDRRTDRRRPPAY